MSETINSYKSLMERMVVTFIDYWDYYCLEVLLVLLVFEVLQDPNFLAAGCASFRLDGNVYRIDVSVPK